MDPEKPRRARTAPPGPPWPRRSVLRLLGGLGAGAAFSRGLVALAEGEPQVTSQMIRQAEWISGQTFDDRERELMLAGVNELLESFEELRRVPLDNGTAPALIFRPADSVPPGPAPRVHPRRPSGSAAPGGEDDVAFAPVTQLAAWLRQRELSAVELTDLHLERLRRYDPALSCVIELTEELARSQAERADRELAQGLDRGPLHGIPWGAKDLLSVPGYRTTWGAKPFERQVRPELATVASRLADRGAVLVAKLTLGALAWGDVWYGGTTKNPWKPDEGSSGSSAGPAAATAAGLVGFSVGSETWGSIVSPCTRCGVTGLRPTFGRVSRHGAMALSWSMDKLGPIARSVEDCALAFDAIQGPDGLDPTVVDRPFGWPLRRDVRTLRVGYVASAFEEDRAQGIEDSEQAQRAEEWQRFDLRTLETLRGLGIEPVPVELPAEHPVRALSFILSAEAACAFDELTRGGRDDELVRQVEQAWPNVLRQAQLIPAVEYLRANRIRSLLCEAMEQLMAQLDVYVCPSFGGDNLLSTNLTGHPAVVVPNGFRASDGTPTSITFTGRLHGETELLAVADAYQQATDFHLLRPPLAAAPQQGAGT
jgi:Asp-tRNA(Asn)/Glu-tRNA(Gln) amidotransferase A subunit family amidase